MFSMATVRTRSFSTFDEDFFLPHTWTPNFPRVSWTLMLISCGLLGLVLWASCCSSLHSPLTAAHENHINHILAHAGHVSCRQPYLLFKLMNRCCITIRDCIVYLSRNNWIDYSLNWKIEDELHNHIHTWVQKILKNVIDWYLQEEDSERDR